MRLSCPKSRARSPGLVLASVLQDASHIAREGSVKGQRTAPRDLPIPSPTLPKLSGLLRGLDGLRGRRHDGSALRDRHGRVDGRRQRYRYAYMQRRAGRCPRGHRDPDRRAVGGLRLDGLAFLGAYVEISQ